MNKIKLLTIFIALSVSFLSCKKDDVSDSPNDFITEQHGEYKIKSWTKKEYSGSSVTAEQTLNDIGTLKLNVVNYGFVSEGTYDKLKEADSQVLANINPALPCFDTFRWTGDETRMTLSYGWCEYRSVLSLTLDGYKRRKQTWTYILTDGEGNMIVTEVFELEKQ